jgi:hypothetical protein
MTIAQGRALLGLPPLPGPRDVVRWAEHRMREIDARIRQRQHADQLAAIHAETAARRRLAEAAAREDKRKALAIYRTIREKHGVSRAPYTLLEWQQREVVEELARTHPLPAIVVRNRDHLLRILRAEGVDVRYAGTDNGYAWRSARRLEVPEPCTMFGVATLAHEGGHILTPPAGTVRRELLAWAWARRHVLDWDADCAESQRDGLLSYRRYGTCAEHAEIDRLIARR